MPDKEIAEPAASPAPIDPTLSSEIIPFVPVGDNGEVVDGSCWVTSIAAPRAGAWRCMAENQIYDPCFSPENESGYVICGASPFDDGRGLRLNLMEPLPEMKPDSTILSPFALVTEDGAKCRFASTGTAIIIEDNLVTYICSDGEVILGDLIPGPIWSALKAELSPDGNTVLRTDRVNLAKIWR